MPSYFGYDQDAGDATHDRIGGSALLPESLPWPVDRAGRKLMFVASLSRELLQTECGIVIPAGQVLSVFCPYEEGGIEAAIDMARGREPGCVIAHEAQAPRQEFDGVALAAKKLEPDRRFETDEDEFAEDIDDKLGGTPNWLQDRFDYPGYDFVMQISGLYFGKVIPAHKGLLMGGVLYVFYDAVRNAGLVRLQYS